MIILKNISKKYLDYTLFENVSLTINNGEKIGLIGNNGSGKSTLLKMIYNEIAFEGQIICMSKNIAYFRQEHSDFETLTVQECLDKALDYLHKLLKKHHDLLLNYDVNQEEIIILENQIAATDAYKIINSQKHIIELFKLRPYLQCTLKELSGGEKSKVMLAYMLLTKSDIIILDEPLNHLDLKAIEWLEAYLKSLQKTIIIVSHDRYFLDAFTTHILHINNNSITKYKGNYSSFRKQKEIVQKNFLKQYEKQQKIISKNEEFIQKNIVRSSTTKRAQSRQKMLAKLEKIELVREKKPIKIAFNYLENHSLHALNINDLTIGYDNPLHSKINLELFNQERLALVGTNGTGKSTFLKTIANQISPLHGNIVIPTNSKIVYFDQTFANLDFNKTIYQYIHDLYPTLTRETILSFLAKFSFSEEESHKKIRILSGGEKVRVSLASISLTKANILVLDEPTNHLDLETKEVLEQALLNYPGTIIFSSHDRYLINKIATKIMIFTNNEIIFANSLLDFRETKVSSKKTNNAYEQQKNIKRLKRKAEKLEAEISQQEEKLSELEKLLFVEEIYTDSHKYSELEQKIKDLQKTIANLYQEYNNCLEVL